MPDEIVLLPEAYEHCVIRELPDDISMYGGNSIEIAGGKVVALITRPCRREEYLPQKEKNGMLEKVWVEKTRLWALVARSSNDLVEEANRRAAAAEMDRGEARRETTTATEELAKVRIERDALIHEATRLRDNFETSQSSVRTASAVNRKLEADLVAVKRHIGEKAYNDALATTPKGT